MVEHLTHEEAEAAIELTRELVKIPSSVRDGPEIYAFTRDYLVDHGVAAEFQEMRNPYLEYQEVSNLLVKVGNGNGPRVMLNCHLDTVPPGEGWYHDPYEPVEEDGRIYGLGAADMKGGCAAAIWSVISLLKRKPKVNGELFLTCVFGEEAPFSLGSDTLLREFDFDDHDLIIVTEPSPLLAINDYCVVHKRLHEGPEFPVVILGAEGRVMFEIEFFGRSSHASHPSQGINALHAAAMVITRLQEFDMFSSIKMGRGHYVVLNIDGGDESFTVPNFCRIMVNRQLTLGETEESVLEELNKIIGSLNLKSKVNIKKRYSPDPLLEYRPYINESSPMLDRFITHLPEPETGQRCMLTTSSVGDFNLFGTRTEAPVLVFGPGGGDIHSADEFVSRQEVVATTDYLLDFFMDVF